MKWITVVLAFLFMSGCGFLLGGLFLMPFLPPVPARPISAFESAFWTDNWAGALLGLVLGSLSARATWRRKSQGNLHGEPKMTGS